MKANYRVKNGVISKNKLVFTEEELTAYLEEEWDKKRDLMYSEAKKDVSAQILAVFFSTLYKPPYNWRKERLLKLKKNIEFTFRDMTTGVMGKNFGTLDCLKFLKEEFGIDFDEENPYNETR